MWQSGNPMSECWQHHTQRGNRWGRHADQSQQLDFHLWLIYAPCSLNKVLTGPFTCLLFSHCGLAMEWTWPLTCPIFYQCGLAMDCTRPLPCRLFPCCSMARNESLIWLDIKLTWQLLVLLNAQRLCLNTQVTLHDAQSRKRSSVTIALAWTTSWLEA